MTKSKLWMLLILMGVFVFAGCSKDEDPDPTPPTVNESEVLATFLESTSSPAGLDFVNEKMPTIISASDVYTLNQTGKVYIIDIRAQADFEAGHIPNAHNVSFANLLTHIAGVDMTAYEKIAIVCYSGQTASYAACLLQLTGCSKAYSMAFGMSAWDSIFAENYWLKTIANGSGYTTQFTTTPTDKGTLGNMPTLATGQTTGATILEARVATLLTEGFSPIATTNAAAVFADPTSFYIVNYWSPAQYADPGHIPGAMQYTPKESMKLATDLKTLPIDKTIVVYCYSGQTSAALTAYLRLLGYDAKSLVYGTNSMIYNTMVADGLPGTFIPENAIIGKPYEVGP
jgi:rhodanese-related sulfurtransferase